MANRGMNCWTRKILYMLFVFGGFLQVVIHTYLAFALLGFM